MEEVYKDREQFAALVRDVAAPDVGRMGVEILSFTIKDLHDDVSYLESLGKSRTAAVKRDAEIGVAQVRINKHASQMHLRWYCHVLCANDTLYGCLLQFRFLT